MENLIYFLIALIVLVVVLSLLWRAGLLTLSLLPLDATGRTVVTILLLILAAAVIWYLVGGSIRWPLR